MDDGFNPDQLLNDIDKIMLKQGYGSGTSITEPVEIEADSTDKPDDFIPSDEIMSHIDNVISRQSDTDVPIGGDGLIQESDAAAVINSDMVSFGTDGDTGVRDKDVAVDVFLRKNPSSASINADQIADDTGSRVMGTDNDVSIKDSHSEMFTTIEDPMEWHTKKEAVEDAPADTDAGEKPPVSYLEGASSAGYQVENVAFGDISVGVETESVEFSVGHPLLRLLRNILICVAAALLLSVLITKFLAHHTAVDGSSMSPTLSDGDQLIFQQMSYYFHDPERFDVVVFPISSEDNYIKRVIGLPGETVQIIDGQVYINGSLLADDRYGLERIQDPGVAADIIYLKSDEYFVLGDNRNASVDSRFSEVGVIKKQNIKAKAWLRFYPFGEFGFVS